MTDLKDEAKHEIDAIEAKLNAAMAVEKTQGAILWAAKWWITGVAIIAALAGAYVARHV